MTTRRRKVNAYQKGRRARLAQQGKCRECPKAAAEGRRRCTLHLMTGSEQSWASQQRHKTAGRCQKCGTRRESDMTRYCRLCYVKQAITAALHGTGVEQQPSWGEIMLAKLDESPVCYLCETTPLTLEGNAQLDHDKPKSREEFGDARHHPDNWRWADQSCNCKKGTKTADEYVAAQFQENIA